jgi:acyl-CoA reductase-like NAD-dependent aldehyde dehydrogenase
MYNVNPDDKVMQDEIFGPVLPFITVKNHQEAIEFINQRFFFSFNLSHLINFKLRKIINREKPLALYVFSNNSQVFEDFKHQTSSGSVVLNETLMHLTRKN